jgi:pSer/pThr/pTyr-binding forkhead associated (FHA) protein
MWRPNRPASTDPWPEGWLVVATGGGLEPGTRFDAFGGVSIGRSSEADIRIDDRYASSIHARVYPAAGGFILEDMRSTNGTLLNGQVVEGEVVLSHGDRIGIGDTELIFEER